MFGASTGTRNVAKLSIIPQLFTVQDVYLLHILWSRNRRHWFLQGISSKTPLLHNPATMSYLTGRSRSLTSHLFLSYAGLAATHLTDNTHASSQKANKPLDLLCHEWVLCSKDAGVLLILDIALQTIQYSSHVPSGNLSILRFSFRRARPRLPPFCCPVAQAAPPVRARPDEAARNVGKFVVEIGELFVDSGGHRNGGP